jgi:hypothetical protein
LLKDLMFDDRMVSVTGKHRSGRNILDCGGRRNIVLEEPSR